MRNILIRRVERRDLEGCVRLEKMCYSEIETAPKDFIEKRIEIYPDGFYVAELNGEIIGMINTGATHKDDITDEELKFLIGHVRNGRNCVIFSLAVHLDYRNNGIAALLTEKVIEVSMRKEKQRVLLLCKDELIDFYTKLGFTYGGLSDSDFGGVRWHQMQFDLPLPSWMIESHHNSATMPVL